MVRGFFQVVIPQARYQGIVNTIVQLIRAQHLGCNRVIAADSVGKARLEKTGLSAPLACQEKNNEYYR